MICFWTQYSALKRKGIEINSSELWCIWDVWLWLEVMHSTSHKPILGPISWLIIYSKREEQWREVPPKCKDTNLFRSSSSYGLIWRTFWRTRAVNTSLRVCSLTWIMSVISVASHDRQQTNAMRRCLWFWLCLCQGWAGGWLFTTSP